MANCTGCKRDREKVNNPPRKLVRLPVEITNHPAFQRKGLPFFLCEHCDENSINAARRTHDRRVKK